MEGGSEWEGVEGGGEWEGVDGVTAGIMSLKRRAGDAHSHMSCLCWSWWPMTNTHEPTICA